MRHNAKRHGNLAGQYKVSKQSRKWIVLLCGLLYVLHRCFVRIAHCRMRRLWNAATGTRFAGREQIIMGCWRWSNENRKIRWFCSEWGGDVC